MGTGLFLGEGIDEASRERTGTRVQIDSAELTTHGVIVGMTGSGKTGLGVVLLEELLRQGVPCLVIDPKGDMGNLALTFPKLDAASFAPWVDGGRARREGIPVDTLADSEASKWAAGLRSWGLGGDDIAALRDRAPVTVYTPGSDAGVPLNILGSLRAPAGSFEDADESLLDEIAGFSAGLLGLVGIDADPLSSREHILLTNLIEKSWRAGRDLDLAALIGQIQTPPMRKLGVFEVDAFFPADDRRALAMRINGLLASPAFARWMQGPDIDIASMLWTPDGDPKAAVVYLSHLSAEERQLVVTLLLSKLATWMQGQPGTSELRALVYMDEVYGFAPPTASPPAKKPILTILKQARAFGVGMVLSTQNPVDLDYKAMSNAGTWLIGRLQTERDKGRILEALQSARGDADTRRLDRVVSDLGKRQFLLHSTSADAPRLLTSRWAMSYLRGPLTREEVSRLPGSSESVPADEAPTAAAAATTEPVVADDESPTPPPIADGIEVVYLDPAATWADEVGAVPGGKRLELCLAARVQLTFDERKAELDHDVEWEAVFDLSDDFDPARAIEVDHDDRDFDRKPPAGARWAIPEAKVDTKPFFTDAARVLREHLYRHEELTLYRNRTLKLHSRVGETEDDFTRRCRAAAQDEADADKRKLHDRAERKLRSIQKAIDAAKRKLAKAEADAAAAQHHEVASGVGSILGVVFGGSRKSAARKAASAIGGASSRRAATARAQNRVAAAHDQIDDKLAEIEQVKDEALRDAAEIDETWADKAQDVETFEVGLEKGDIDVGDFVAVWVPRD